MVLYITIYFSLIRFKAVLVRVAADSILSDASEEDKRTAAQHANIIVIAILITSTAGSVLTTALGPILLSQDSRISPGGNNLKHIKCFQLE